MRIVLEAIAGGKTYQMVQSFIRHNNSILLVINHEEKKRIISQYKIDSKKAGDILIFSNYERQLRGQHDKEIYIDNADMFLEYLFMGHKVKGISMTD